MSRPRKSTGPTPVESITHADKRTNIPTADAAQSYGFDEEKAKLPPLRYPRDPSLDPQLVWKGKDAQDGEDLIVDAPPIYIQEKVEPRALIENLRKTAAAGQPEPELTLFDEYDELDELSQVEFYQHQESWKNRMILGDSLQVMGSLAEREGLRGQVQMVYIDPPYGIKFGSNWQVSTRKRDVKDGSLADAAREAEQIKAFRDTWELGIHSYLSYLRDRLVIARDLLTGSGSVFVQIGDENVHLVRSLMDEVMGSDNFVSLITYAKTTGAGSGAGGTDVLASVTDYLLWYARDRSAIKYRQLYLAKDAGGAGATKYDQVEESGGARRSATPNEKAGDLADGSRLFRLDNLMSQTGVDKTRFPITINGRTFTPGTSVWKTGETGMARLLAANRVAVLKNSLGYVRYLDDFAAFPINNVWADLGGVQSRADPKVYVVQTATSAIQRCVLMTTDPGDLILDPTCGAGTTAYVAEQWGRRWITIDTSRVALALARQRLMASAHPYYLLVDSASGRRKEQELTGRALPPAEVHEDVRHGFVYERVPHIMLKDIANNPDIREGMSREAIRQAINRYAEQELLFDKPCEDNSRVRVAGPFTIESLSPHRSLSFDEADAFHESATETDDRSFEQSVLQNLQKAGIQNGRKEERIKFASVETYPGQYLQAIGERKHDESDTAASRIAIALGPQYGTVSPGFIKSAAKEAIAAGIELVAILGFAFDPLATGVTEADGVTVVSGDEGFANVAGERHLGRTQVLLVRMNSDLLMGEELKKTGAGNLFTVFGEPDIEITELEDGKLQVKLRGVDVYDPTTGEPRSAGIEQIALWMIDTDYNDESFFVRHCYFTGGGDPYKKLKTALKAEINEEAWATLYSGTSQPFNPPSTGKIAIKVINDYGDEVMKVIEVA